MGTCISCCELYDINGENSLRYILSSLGITSITEIEFRSILQRNTRDNAIRISQFLECMQSFWSNEESIKRIQISIFENYFASYHDNDMSIYFILIILLPFFEIGSEEKCMTLIELFKLITYPKYSYTALKEIIEMYFYFYTIFVTKVVIEEFRIDGRHQESFELRNLLMNVFTEEQVEMEVSNLLNNIPSSTNLTTNDITELVKKVPLNVRDLRAGFILKYLSSY